MGWVKGKEEFSSGSMSSGVGTKAGAKNLGWGRKDQKMLCGEDGP